MLSMSNVPIAGQPSLSANAIGVRFAACICFHSVTISSRVVGWVQPFSSKIDLR